MSIENRNLHEVLKLQFTTTVVIQWCIYTYKLLTVTLSTMFRNHINQYLVSLWQIWVNMSQFCGLVMNMVSIVCVCTMVKNLNFELDDHKFEWYISQRENSVQLSLIHITLPLSSNTPCCALLDYLVCQCNQHDSLLLI